MKQIEQIITTVEIAEMMEMRHDTVIRKLDGRIANGKKVKGIIEVMTDHHLAVSDYFTESTYKDNSGKMNKCYNCTRKGCEFLAHKFNGEKGILFTIRYIERFHNMEQAMQQIAENQKQAEQLKIQEHSNTYLLPVADSWFNEMNDIFERVCAFYNWKRSRLYHEILNELSERYDIQKAIETYKIEKGEEPKYIMDVVEWFPQLRNETVKIMKRYESVGNV